jgi:hypothetical protein
LRAPRSGLIRALADTLAGPGADKDADALARQRLLDALDAEAEEEDQDDPLE